MRVVPLRRRPRARFSNLFIVTYGRSGSTLIQGMINTIPGYVVRGENNDIAGSLLAAYRQMPQRAFGPRVCDTTDPYYGQEYLNSPYYMKGFRRFFEEVLLADQARAGVRCFGFKEVRYTPEDIDDKLKFLRAVFPECCFVFNIRAAAEVVASQKSVAFPDVRSVEDIAALDGFFHDYAQTHDHGAVVDYRDVKALSGSFRALFDFLGEPFDQERLRRQLSLKHSYHLS